ncbi:allantoate amidohydrolase [Nocardioides sp. GY 10113]|uniref:allantoate amidohydrolase n=1 Tax=Nocardioides sp. GY 10113 TaxID=2569761 RepID=UPI001F0E2E5D|nr:allantoate amidohydrolase [Nocardioides sp. GY 10113]
MTSSASNGPDFEQMWSALLPIGRSAASGGYFRQPWHGAEVELRAWFVEEADRRGLEVEHDAFGNMVAWWRPDGAAGPAVLTGSHLDSVLDGGAFDGPLGVVSALAAYDRLVESGVRPDRPLAIGVFAEEEGSRFGRACLGSRLAVGAASWEDARSLTDADGVRLGDVVEGGAPSSWLAGVGAYVELHVEQGRGLVDLDAAVGAASGIWPHGRWRFDFTGRADHAGAARMEDRADPMLSYAMTALAANKQARLAGQRATFGRVEVAPNGTNVVPSRVSAWLDARADSPSGMADLVAEIERQAAARAERDGTSLSVTAESVTGAVSFDPVLRGRVDGLLGGAVPVLPSIAGHDAGVLQEAGIPTAMLFVRNPTGVSHAPAESAGTDDCLAGVEALATALTGLLTGPGE